MAPVCHRRTVSAAGELKEGILEQFGERDGGGWLRLRKKIISILLIDSGVPVPNITT